MRTRQMIEESEKDRQAYIARQSNPALAQEVFVFISDYM